MKNANLISRMFLCFSFMYLIGLSVDQSGELAGQEKGLAHLSGQVAPVFDEGCIAFGHVDLKNCDFEKVAKKIREWGVPVNSEAAEVYESLKEKIMVAGGRHIFVTFSLIDLTANPVIAIPLSKNVADKSVQELLDIEVDPRFTSTYLRSSRLLVVGPPQSLGRIKQNQLTARKDIKELLNAVETEIASIRFVPSADHLRVIREFKSELLPEKLGLDENAVANGIQSGSLILSSVDPFELQMRINSSNVDAAKSLAKLVRSLPEVIPGDDAGQMILRLMASGIKVSSDKPGLSWVVGENEYKIWKMIIKPVISNASQQVKATTEVRNLKMILLGMHNFHDTYRGFPDLGLPKDKSKPGLSWRVHILPFVEEIELYNQFHLDEPWNSEHNIKLVSKMPNIFRSAEKTDEGKTLLVMPRGKGFFASPYAKEKDLKSTFAGRSFREILDGTSNTVAVMKVESKSAVIWSKPEDWNPSPENIKKFLAAKEGSTFNFATADGAVHRVDWKKLNAAKLKTMLTISGGEIIDFHGDLGK